MRYMRMTIDEAITRYKNNAEYERTHGNLQGCLEFKQLAKWLEELRAYRNMYHADNVDNCLREKVVANGMSIDEAIEIINHYLDYPKEEVRKALLVAISIMRKHQKIQEIIDNWTKTEELEWKIREVLDNGNDD